MDALRRPGARPHGRRGAGGQPRPARQPRSASSRRARSSASTRAEPALRMPACAIPRRAPLLAGGLGAAAARMRSSPPTIAWRLRRRVGAGFLGQVPARHRGRARGTRRERGGPRGDPQFAHGRSDSRLLRAARARPAARGRRPHPRQPRAVARTAEAAPRRRRGLRARVPPGRSDLRGALALVPAVRQRRSRRKARSRCCSAAARARCSRPASSAAVAVRPRGRGARGLPSDLLLRRPDLRQAEESPAARPTRASALRAPRISRRSSSPAPSAARASGSATSSVARRAPGASAATCCSRCSPAGRSAAASTSPTHARARRRSPTRRPSPTRSAKCATRSPRRPTCASRPRAAGARRGDLARTRARQAALRQRCGAASSSSSITERQLLVVRLDAIDAERDRRNAIVDLYLALGG